MTRKRAEEYRWLEEECLILARAVSGAPRATPIRMARVWERLAVEQEEADHARSVNRE